MMLMAGFDGARLEVEDGWVFTFKPLEKIDLEETWWVVEGAVGNYDSDGILRFILQPYKHRKMKCTNFIRDLHTGEFKVDIFVMQV